MTTHTPGPWTVTDGGNVFTEASSGLATEDNGFRCVAIVGGHRDRRFVARQERDANARLIAHAPAMLAIARKLVDWDSDGNSASNMEKIYEAIQEARAILRAVDSDV